MKKPFPTQENLSNSPMPFKAIILCTSKIRFLQTRITYTMMNILPQRYRHADYHRGEFKMKNATINDIAHEAGVSSATVSKYLNGKKISDANAKRIQSSILRLHYVPNPIAQLLRKKTSSCIAVILTNMCDYFWGNSCNEIENFLLGHDYSTLLQRFDPSIEDQTDFFNFLMSTGISGCILLDETSAQTNLLDLLHSRGIPYVFMDSCPAAGSYDLVTTSNYHSSYRATEYLISRGHRTFGVLSGPQTHYTNAERLRGFTDACKAHGIPKENIQIRYGSFRVEAGYPMVQDLLKQRPLPSVLFSMNYYYMVSTIQEVSAKGLSVPDDISLITFDDDDLFQTVNPPITVIRQDLPAIGRNTAELLYRRITESDPSAPEFLEIDAQLIQRGSVANLTR